MEEDEKGLGLADPITNAEQHIKTRTAQENYDDSHHHPKEKILQLEALDKMGVIQGDILEVFAGKGNLTEWYKTKGNVTAMTKETFGNSFDSIYALRRERRKFDVIDIDSYGYPDKFFPVVFEMMKDTCVLIFTFPMLGVQCLNGIYEVHYMTFWRSTRPTIGDVVGVLTDFGLREWRLISLLDVRKIKPILRFAFNCKRVKATEMCNVRNR